MTTDPITRTPADERGEAFDPSKPFTTRDGRTVHGLVMRGEVLFDEDWTEVDWRLNGTHRRGKRDLDLINTPAPPAGGEPPQPITDADRQAAYAALGTMTPYGTGDIDGLLRWAQARYATPAPVQVAAGAGKRDGLLRAAEIAQFFRQLYADKCAKVGHDARLAAISVGAREVMLAIRAEADALPAERTQGESEDAAFVERMAKTVGYNPDGKVVVSSSLDRVDQARLIALARRGATRPAPDAADILTEACEPWKFSTGAPPDYDSPLNGVFVAGMLYSEKLLCALLGVERYEGGDGSEDFDTDATTSLRNILTAAKLHDPEDGSWAKLATPDAENALTKARRLLAELDELLHEPVSGLAEDHRQWAHGMVHQAAAHLSDREEIRAQAARETPLMEAAIASDAGDVEARIAAVLAEREACAQTVDDLADTYLADFQRGCNQAGHFNTAARIISRRIRARPTPQPAAVLAGDAS